MKLFLTAITTLLITNTSFAGDLYLVCEDPLDDTQIDLANEPLVNGKATVNFDDNINLGRDIESLYYGYTVELTKNSNDDYYTMKTYVNFMGGLRLKVETYKQVDLGLSYPILPMDQALKGGNDDDAVAARCAIRD